MLEKNITEDITKRSLTSIDNICKNIEIVIYEIILNKKFIKDYILNGVFFLL